MNHFCRRAETPSIFQRMMAGCRIGHGRWDGAEQTIIGGVAAVA